MWTSTPSIRDARATAVRAGVADRVTVRTEADIQSATVDRLFLSPELNARLHPKLTSQLRPGLYRLPPLRHRRLGARADGDALGLRNP